MMNKMGKKKSSKKIKSKPNQPLAQWVSDAANMEHALICVQVGEHGSIPVSNRLCPLCNPKDLGPINDLTDEEIIEWVHAGKLHGWSAINGAICVWNNKVYHIKCLRAELSDAVYDADDNIIEIR